MLFGLNSVILLELLFLLTFLHFDLVLSLMERKILSALVEQQNLRQVAVLKI